MATIIAGSRSISDKQLVYETINSAPFDVQEVVSGKADGVDTIGEEWASDNDIPIKNFPYTNYISEAPTEKVAPLIRNTKMAQYADELILIWDGNSNGSKDMLKKAKEYDLEIYEKRTKDSTIDEWI